MKIFSLKQIVATGIALAGLALTPSSPAQVTVNVEGGSASSTVIFDRATNLFAGNPITITGSAKANVATFVGTSANPLLTGYGQITLNVNLNNGAVNGLKALANQTAFVGDTNAAGNPIIPTFVDSATSPETAGINSTTYNIVDYPTPVYVVPLVYAVNALYPDVYGITNLTLRQAASLETSTNKATFYGGTSTNIVYFVGRNTQAAVRSIIDLSIYKNIVATIKTYTNSAANLPVQDGSADPGYSSASKVVTAITVLTNSIGTIAAQNLSGTNGLVPIAIEGVPYTVTNVINGSYPIWGYEHYYYIAPGFTGTPSTAQKAVIDVFYNSVTNAAFQSLTNPVFTNNFVPYPAMKVKRLADGGPIIPLGNY
jgi:hypothetical protein